MVHDRKRAQPVTVLKGWREIADFLGQPLSTAQRWAKQGMPITREGRRVIATPEELNRWLGREIGEKQPARIASPDEDLAADLRQSLKTLRGSKSK